MAVYGGVAVGKPLRLKDFLELDCDSCSAAGFRCYPRRLCVAGVTAAAAGPSPMRQLLEAAAEAPRGFGRSHSHSLRRPSLSHLSRSLSRRLRGGFSWRRREEEPAPSAAACSQEVAVSSTCYSSSSDSEASESGSSSSTETKYESDFSSASPHAGAAAATTATTAGDEHEAMKEETKESGCGSETDHEKEQLSPVAVMDFPFDDDDDNEDEVEKEGRDGGSAACSPSFSESLAQLQRRKTQLAHKIRRFGSIGELGAADLEARFAASDSDGLGNVPANQQRQCCTDACATTAPPPRHNDGHQSADVYQDPDERSLVGLLTGTVSAAAGVDGVCERLLLDFFAETVEKLSTPENSEAAARLAKRWLDGTGARWGLKEVLCSREDLVKEMERSRRWSARIGGEQEEREVGVVVAGLVIGELVDELVSDLLVQVRQIEEV